MKATKATIPVSPPICQHLRWKGRSREATTGEQQFAFARNQVPYTCLRTCQPWGPDDEPAVLPERRELRPELLIESQPVDDEPTRARIRTAVSRWSLRQSGVASTEPSAGVEILEITEKGMMRWGQMCPGARATGVGSRSSQRASTRARPRATRRARTTAGRARPSARRRSGRRRRGPRRAGRAAGVRGARRRRRRSR